ncbi:MAG: substrate-binding domain-containing protein [Vicinamibacterales bacterium]
MGFGAITEIRDFASQGVTLVGPLPREVQNCTIYHAVVTREARALEAPQQFVRSLATPAARQTFQATGMEASHEPQ